MSRIRINTIEEYTPAAGIDVLSLLRLLSGLEVTGDVSADSFTGPLTGDVTGDVTGNLTGNVTGDVTGDVLGDVTGHLTGNVTGNADTATNATHATNADTATNAGHATTADSATTAGSSTTAATAAQADKLTTARTINGTSFDGTANVVVAAAAGTLTGTTLASGVVASSLTSLGTLSSLTVSGDTLFSTNETYLKGKNTSGVTKKIIGINSLNQVNISTDGLDVYVSANMWLAGALELDKAESATVGTTTGQILGTSQWWQLRQSTDHSVNLDVYNSASPIVGWTTFQDGMFAFGGIARLKNNTALKSRNAAGSGDVTIALVDTSNRIVLGGGNEVRTPGTLVCLGGLVLFTGGVSADASGTSAFYSMYVLNQTTLGSAAAAPGTRTLMVHTGTGRNFHVYDLSSTTVTESSDDAGTTYKDIRHYALKHSWYVSATKGLELDASATADDTRLLVYDVSAAAMVRVSRGVSDSGGVGFRLLRIPN